METSEGRAAEQRLLRLAEELVGHIQKLDTSSGAQLADLLDRARATRINQFILLVGTKGAGKTTFIHRFFESKLPASLRQACVPIFVNLADSQGDEQTVVNWLKKNLLEQAELALGDSVATWDELIGHMFFGEYQRWTRGTMSNLYQKDKDEFKIQFGNHIERIRREEPIEYLFRLLRNFIKGRQQIPCLIFDNADHFSIDFQEKVFQFARSLFERELCIVIMPMTDKTSWQLAANGALSSFENEALLLPTPPATIILERRISFALKKIEEEQKEKGGYFIGKGIRVDINNLMKFVRGLEEVFLSSPNTTYIVGQRANYNIRDVLEILRDVINSPHVGLNETFKAYVLGTAVHIEDFKIRKALIRGRYDIFVQTANRFVHNMFALNAELETSPLLGIRILQALKDAVVRYGATKSPYIAKADLYSYLIAMGFERRAISLWLDALLKSALIVNYDPTCVSDATATRLEVSPSGDQHLFWARGNYDYVEAMAEVTAILDQAAYEVIERSSRGQSGRRNQRQFIRAFADYLRAEDRLFCAVPDHESYRGQMGLTDRLG
ncbi:MAG: AAA family ATPase [Xanthobacteraceae bacterium]